MCCRVVVLFCNEPILINFKIKKYYIEHIIKIIVACCALHNFIYLHQKGISISARDPNMSIPTNV